jgi:hypothetical protein
VLMRIILNTFLLLALASCATALPAFPPAVIPPSPSATEWPDAGAAVLDDIRTLEYRETSAGDRQRLIAVLVHRLRYKVLTPRGLRHATMKLPVDGYSSITKVAGRSVHPNGREVYLRQVDIVPKDKRGRRVPVGAVGEVTMTVPDAEVGGLVEFQYERVFTDPDMVPVMVLGRDVPVLRSEIALITPENVRVDYNFGRGGKIVEPHPILTKMPNGLDKLVFVEKSLPAFHPEPSMPDLTWVTAWIDFNIASAQVEDRMYRLENWKHIGARMQFLFDAAGDLPPATGSAIERYRAIQSDLKIVEVDGVGVLPPRSTVALRERKPVSGRDAAALLQRSLKDAGIEAYPALLTSPKGPIVMSGFPSISPFKRVVVAVKAKDVMNDAQNCATSSLLARGPLCSVADHGFVFVDPMCKTCRFGELPPDLMGGTALLVGMRNPRFVSVGVGHPETNLVVTHYEMSSTGVGNVSGGVSVQVIGQSASTFRKTLLELPPDADISDFIQGHLRFEDKQVGFRSGSSENVRDLSKPLTLSASTELKNVKVDYDTFSFSLADAMGPSLPGAYRQVRQFPRVLDAPARWDTTLRLELPAGYRVLAPEPLDLSWGGISYYLACEVTDEHLTCARRVEMKPKIVMTTHWSQFRTMVEKMREQDKAQVTVARTPAGLDESAQ